MRISLVVFKLFLSVSLWAKTLVIADIDDTLRVTNRLYGSYVEQLDNVLNLEMPFAGTKELLDSFDQKSARIYYVTAAISPFNTFSTDFLNYQNYPQRENFIYRSWGEDVESFKVEQILNLILKESPDEVILFGDNGEKDPVVYEKVQKLYPQTQVFIHYLYKGGESADVPAIQTLYITSAEVAAYLEERGMFSVSDSLSVMRAVAGVLESEFSSSHDLVVPYWSDIVSEDIIAFFSYKFVIAPDSQKYLDSIGQALSQ